MKIAIASGKGGTGKTTLSVNLARSLDSNVILLDCDVEEPNAHLFVKGDLINEKPVFIKIPQIDGNVCNNCGECSRFCEFNAIASIEVKTLVFPDLCHACGGCTKICQRKAITEIDKKIGVLETRKSGNITLVSGRLDVGVAMAPPVIRELKKHLEREENIILDAPPGTSCPVIATLKDVDFVVLVTEPTPFGLNDLSLAVDMTKELKIPFGVVVNRYGIGDDRVHNFCQAKNVKILAEIPNDIRIAKAYSNGELIVDALPEFNSLFAKLNLKIKEMM